MTPLVRAKRLVWEQHSDVHWSAYAMCGAFSVCLENSKWRVWSSSYNYDHEIDTFADSLDHGKQLCQLDFDLRWLESTEVCELVWHRINETREQAIAAGVLYRLTERPTGEWSIFSNVQPTPEVFASRLLATQYANQHNRDTILGEVK